MKRNTRRQTPAEKRQADYHQAVNGAQALRNYIAKYPTDRFNPDRIRQAEMLEAKAAQLAA